jgi:hypothetical protein
MGDAIYGVPWIPSIYPLYVSINIPAPHHGSYGSGNPIFNGKKLWFPVKIFLKTNPIIRDKKSRLSQAIIPFSRPGPAKNRSPNPEDID